jgi:ElaB/YqjD/DUF883 family membrane-anchored ribosome-binding protein
MQKSYVLEQTMQFKMDIDLGEINQLIDVLDQLIDDDTSNNWKAKELASKLRSVRRSTVEEAKREFDSMLDRV